MENEKLFGFMEKMYSEMQDEFKKIKDGQEALKLEVKQNTNSITSLKNELKETKKTLYDGYTQNYEMTSATKKLVEKNSEDILEINASITEMKEDINFIASKTIRNDSKIDKINEKLKAVK